MSDSVLFFPERFHVDGDMIRVVSDIVIQFVVTFKVLF